MPRNGWPLPLAPAALNSGEADKKSLFDDFRVAGMVWVSQAHFCLNFPPHAAIVQAIRGKIGASRSRGWLLGLTETNKLLL